ncbi:MAG: hypothetical protein PVH88_10565 [Ignavibacteria bacterium]|jgi:hypothetical protein
MSENEEENTTSKNVSGNKSQIYTVSLSIGTGHLRNVTPVVSALRLQERMKQLNLISSNLTNEEIYSLSQTFAKKNYFEKAYERPGKYFWGDVFSSVPSLKKTFETLNPFALEYLKEVTEELRFIRREGYFIQANLFFSYYNHYYMHDHGYPELLNRQTHISEEFYVKAGISASYAKQLNLESQVYLNCSLEGGPNVIENSEIKQEYNLEINGIYNYELTDRLVASLYAEYTYNIENGFEQGTSKSFTCELSLDYFIEDNISINVNYEYIKGFYNNSTMYGTVDIEDNYFSIGCNYFFTRSILF